MILSDKRKIRQAVRAEIAKLSDEEKKSLSAQIFSELDNRNEVCNASIIALFISLPDEPQTATFGQKQAHCGATHRG